MKTGRYGSIAVKLPTHVPPMPSETSTRGPTQHAEAPMPAKTLAINVLPPEILAMPNTSNKFAA